MTPLHHVGARHGGADWAGVIRLGAIVGAGVLGYIIYRQLVVTGGTLRGAKRVFTGGS